MQYNIHPIFVHFPIAFLFLYSILKVLPTKKLFPKVHWEHIEKILLLAGVLGAFAASSTGEIAEHLTNPPHDIFKLHEEFAEASIAFYSIALVLEFLTFIKPLLQKIKVKALHQIIALIEKLFVNRFVIALLAVAGLICISITGMLGGILVHGTSADPLAPLLLKILN